MQAACTRQTKTTSRTATSRSPTSSTILSRTSSRMHIHSKITLQSMPTPTIMTTNRIWIMTSSTRTRRKTSRSTNEKCTMKHPPTMPRGPEDNRNRNKSRNCNRNTHTPRKTSRSSSGRYVCTRYQLKKYHQLHQLTVKSSSVRLQTRNISPTRILSCTRTMTSTTPT